MTKQPAIKQKSLMTRGIVKDNHKILMTKKEIEKFIIKKIKLIAPALYTMQISALFITDLVARPIIFDEISVMASKSFHAVIFILQCV